MLEFYNQVLVPVFAAAGAIALALNVWKFFEDRQRASRRISLRVVGSNFRITNESQADVFFARGGYIDRDWKAVPSRFELLGIDASVDGRIERNGTATLSVSIGTALNAAWAESQGAEIIPARGWWARLMTGESATTIAPWNLYGRCRFWLANRAEL